MSKLSANYLAIREDQNYKIKGRDLFHGARSSDEFLAQRGDDLYKVKVDVGPGIIESVGAVDFDFNFGQYLKIINTQTGQVLPASDFCDACYDPELRNPRRLFNGIDTVDNRLQYATRGNSAIYSTLVIDFPGDIPVYESIEIKAGFHELAQTGQLLINDQVVTELDAWDRDPKSFTASYNGKIDTFAIRMKNLSPLQDPTYSNNTTGAINYIKVDGIQLLDLANVIQLTMAEGTDMSRYRPFTRVKQTRYDLIDYESPQQQPLRVVEGVIGDVNEATRQITLFNPPPTGPRAVNFEPGGYLEIEIAGESEFSEILDDDLFVCTDVNDVTYKVTGEQFKQVINSPEERRYKCWQESVSEYLQCKLLCESDYCLSICLKEFTNQVTLCATIEDEI
jgi:hypothetical protein